MDQLTFPDFDCHSEIGMDLNNLKAKKVAVYTDSTVSGQSRKGWILDKRCGQKM